MSSSLKKWLRVIVKRIFRKNLNLPTPALAIEEEDKKGG